ncbi:macrophage mannose receptor 1-like [Lacerta agilis]|uniref:macrophage mannose receptor 1-like n=1 Tax=Lacerta agilis TaxID=80427 RepID=UPI001419E46D|nr:macrophage mannose receptor 1-like [Lacerta agilis]
MSFFLFLSLLVLIQPAFQVSESDSFLIYNENLKLCMQSWNTRSIILDYCDKSNEQQNFRWVSNSHILNMATKLCLAVPSKSDQARVTLSSCNETIELQKWECTNDTKILGLELQDLFVTPEGGQKGRLMLSNKATSKNTWKIYGTEDKLCSKHYEALYTIEGNALGAPCRFPFKYQNKWYAQCIRDVDHHGQLWCGATEDVDRDSLTGYCPIKDGHDEFFWTRNHWTGDLYQINSYSALTWFQASKSCQQQNAELLSITDLQEQAYLTGLINDKKNDYWIGLNSFDVESGWQWIGDRPFRYLNWAPGSPSPETEKICGSIQSNNGKWQNKKCQDNLGYICKRENFSLDTSVIPPESRLPSASVVPQSSVLGLDEGIEGMLIKVADEIKLHAILNMVFLFLGRSKPIKCSDGWAAYEGHCYRRYRHLKTWQQALSSCRKEDGDLISIHNIEEHSFIISQLGYQPEDSLWIGLNDRKTQMYFEWSDGSTVRLTKWQKGKPTHINDVQNDCVFMNGENGYWADNFCEEELGYICKRAPLAILSEEPETADPNCTKGWRRHGYYCYLIEQTSRTFSEAKTSCAANQGSLTSVENRYEQAFLTSLVGLRSEKYFWIGLSDVEQPGTFNWTNGDSVLFTHWNSRMPGRQPGCVAMRTGTAAGLWDVVNCEEKAAFICKQWAEGVTTTPAPKPTPLPACPNEWHPSNTRHVCFKAYYKEKKSRKSWFEAQDFCREIGGDLASIHSENEKGVITELIRKTTGHYWIGFSELAPDKGFTWSDGSPVDFEWDFHLRDRHNEDTGCRALYSSVGRVDSDWCEYFKNWVCQIKRGATVKKDPLVGFEYTFSRVENGWILHNGSEYYFSNASSSAERAWEFCKKQSADLVVIESESERQFLWKYNQLYRHFNNHYIGLTVDFDKSYSWLNGTPVTYEAWAPNEPNFSNEDENCVVMYYNTGLWNDINCGAANRFICERDTSSVHSAPVPTIPAPVGGCADGWLFFDKKCFKLLGLNEEERKDWHKARHDCKESGGNLASIPNKETQAFLMVQLQSAAIDPWIGLNDCSTNYKFVWTSGSGVYFTNWARRFPSYKGDCVFIMNEPLLQAGRWRNGPCSDRKSYICQRNTDPALSQPETMAPASRHIPFGNSSYSFIGPKMTWEEARKKCNSEHSELASIWNPYIQSFLWLWALKYGEPVWIGLNSNMTGGRYTWINNRKLAYTNWAPEEPKQKTACVYLDHDGHWKTGACNETYFSACAQYNGTIPTEEPQLPGRCPASKEDGKAWIPFRAHCYQFYSGWYNWPRALFECAQLGATLTSVADLAELHFLMVHTFHLSMDEYWIGMYRNYDGEWLWQDNTALDFVNWDNEKPTPDPKSQRFQNEKCVFINSQNGKWFREYCAHSKGYICKINKIIEEVTAPSKVPEQEDSLASTHGRVLKAFLLVIFLLLIGVGVAVCVFYKRRGRRQEITGSIDNPMYHDTVVILPNKESEMGEDEKEAE